MLKISHKGSLRKSPVVTPVWLQLFKILRVFAISWRDISTKSAVSSLCETCVFYFKIVLVMPFKTQHHQIGYSPESYHEICFHIWEGIINDMQDTLEIHGSFERHSERCQQFCGCQLPQKYHSYRSPIAEIENNFTRTKHWFWDYRGRDETIVWGVPTIRALELEAQTSSIHWEVSTELKRTEKPKSTTGPVLFSIHVRGQKTLTIYLAIQPAIGVMDLLIQTKSCSIS